MNSRSKKYQEIRVLDSDGAIKKLVKKRELHILPFSDLRGQKIRPLQVRFCCLICSNVDSPKSSAALIRFLHFQEQNEMDRQRSQVAATGNSSTNDVSVEHGNQASSGGDASGARSDRNPPHNTHFVTPESQTTASRQFMPQSKDSQKEESDFRGKTQMSLQSNPNTKERDFSTSAQSTVERDRDSANKKEFGDTSDKQHRDSSSQSSGPSFVVLPRGVPDDGSSSLSLWSMPEDLGSTNFPSVDSTNGTSHVLSDTSLMSQVRFSLKFANRSVCLSFLFGENKREYEIRS